jgi:hypothetical protein
VSATGGGSVIITQIAAVVLVAASGVAFSPAAATASSSASTPLRIQIAPGQQTPTETRYLSSNYDPAKGYIIDRQAVTLEAGYDLPEPGLLSHRIDLKWKIKNTIKCVDLGSDVCPDATLRYAGLECVDSKGRPDIVCGGPGWDWTGLSDDKPLRCPSYKSTLVALKPGQSFTICTSSQLFDQEAASGASYSLGYDVPYVKDFSHITVHWTLADPWDALKGKPAPIGHRHWTCAHPDRWSENTPPGCTDTGAFRRVFSGPGIFGATAIAQLPATESDVSPEVPGELKNQAGYIYLEGWAGPGSTNVEFGFQYNQETNNYTLYSRGPGFYWNPGGADKGIRFKAGDRVRLTMSAYPIGHLRDPHWPAVAGCADKKACLVVRMEDLTTGTVIEHAFEVAGWHGNRQIFARMTSIAQGATPPLLGNIFDDGAIFGPIRWTRAQLSEMSASGVQASDWAGGGDQDWPDDSSRVIVANRSGQASETDILDLHP